MLSDATRPDIGMRARRSQTSRTRGPQAGPLGAHHEDRVARPGDAAVVLAALGFGADRQPGAAARARRARSAVMLPTWAIARCSVAPADAFTTIGGHPRAAPARDRDARRAHRLGHAGDGAEVARVLGAVQADERRPAAPAGRAARRRGRGRSMATTPWWSAVPARRPELVAVAPRAPGRPPATAPRASCGSAQTSWTSRAPGGQQLAHRVAPVDGLAAVGPQAAAGSCRVDPRAPGGVGDLEAQVADPRPQRVGLGEVARLARLLARGRRSSITSSGTAAGRAGVDAAEARAGRAARPARGGPRAAARRPPAPAATARLVPRTISNRAAKASGVPKSSSRARKNWSRPSTTVRGQVGVVPLLRPGRHRPRRGPAARWPAGRPPPAPAPSAPP